MKNEDPNQIFMSTVPCNIVIPEMDKPSYFGILDVRPDRIKEPPRFTEPATLEAMSNLGILSSELVPKDPTEYAEKDLSIQIQIQIELEKRRLATIERIITERQLILNKKFGTKSKSEEKEKKEEEVEKKPKKTKKGKKGKKSKAAKTGKTSDAPETKPQKVSGVSKLPELKRKKKKKVDPLQLPTNRRVKKKSVIDMRMERASMAKAKNEEAKVEIALSALKKVEEVEKRQQELRMKQQQLIKEKAQKRLNRLAKKEALAEQNLNKRKEIAKNEMMRQEEQYNKIRERERKKYEKEYKKRMQKIYGGQKAQVNKKESKSSLAELRKKIIASKLSSVPPTPKQSSASAKIPKQDSMKNELLSQKKKKSTKNTPMHSPPTTIESIINIPIKKVNPIVPAKGSRIPFLKPKK